MAPRHYWLLQYWICFRPAAAESRASSSCGGIQQVIAFVRSRHFSSDVKGQEASISGKRWFELPPVPKPLPVRPSWELKRGQRDVNRDASEKVDENFELGNRMQQLTALQWVAKCCPSVPNSLIQKLFRLRQIRKRTPSSGMSDTQRDDLLHSPSDIQMLEHCLKRRMEESGRQGTQGYSKSQPDPRLPPARLKKKRVSGKAIVEEGAVLFIPNSVFQQEKSDIVQFQYKKTQHQPTPDEIMWLQNLVLYKDTQIIVINKPPGLPVQGGSDVRRSLDSLMGTALRFEHTDGPKLVHRLDKETSGAMVLARTQESASLFHSLFRNKTATASSTTETNYELSAIERSYTALVIGVPENTQGRISAPLIKVVVDKGGADKIMVAHDYLSDNAQVAITDYKVIGSSHCGTTWLELHPVTGRKHQLRVHCAEVLGTPVVGDLKYGWRAHRFWDEHIQLQDQEGSKEGVDTRESFRNSEGARVKGSVLSKVPMLHLHCHELAIPDVARLLEMESSAVHRRDWDKALKFDAPLPPHMAWSKRVLSSMK